MLNNNHLLERADYVLELGNKALSSKFSTSDDFFIHYHVKPEFHKEFQSLALSFIINIYGEHHPFYKQFNENVKSATPVAVENGIGILKSIRTEIDKGWLVTLKGLVAAEIFTDFIDTAEYLLSQKYKDPAAVIIGSTLEEHLRQLSRKYNLPVEEIKPNGKTIPMKAETLNIELAKKGVYNLLEQKSVTSWLDLRNKAAHGKYSEYTEEQVDLLIQSITSFITRNPV